MIGVSLNGTLATVYSVYQMRRTLHPLRPLHAPGGAANTAGTTHLLRPRPAAAASQMKMLPAAYAATTAAQVFKQCSLAAATCYSPFARRSIDPAANPPALLLIPPTMPTPHTARVSPGAASPTR